MHVRKIACSTCPFRRSNLTDFGYAKEGLVIDEERQELVVDGLRDGKTWECHDSETRIHCAGAARVMYGLGFTARLGPEDPDLITTVTEWEEHMTTIRTRCESEGIKWRD